MLLEKAFLGSIFQKKIMQQLKNVRPTGQPAGQKFSTGPGRPFTVTGYNYAVAPLIEADFAAL